MDAEDSWQVGDAVWRLVRGAVVPLRTTPVEPHRDARRHEGTSDSSRWSSAAGCGARPA